MARAIPIETEIGTIHRRSAIFLDSIEYPAGTSVLIIEGEIGGYACRPVQLEGDSSSS